MRNFSDNMLNFSDKMLNFSRNDTLGIEKSTSHQRVSLELRNVILNVNSIILLFLSIIGIPANILNMIIFGKMGLGLSINISFVTLSATDFLCALVYVCVAVITLDTSGMLTLPVEMTDVLYLFLPVIMCLSAFGSWVTAIINIERCIAVFRYRRFDPISKRRYITGLIAAMFIVQAVIIGLNLSSINLTVINTGDRSEVNLNNTDIGDTLSIPSIFWGSSVVTLVCFIIVLVCTISLGISLTQRNRWLQSMPGLQGQHIARNKTLVTKVVAISVIYIICYLPGAIVVSGYVACGCLKPFRPEEDNLSFVLASFVRNLQALSATTNIFIYWKISQKYREYMTNLLCYTCARVRGLHQ